MTGRLTLLLTTPRVAPGLLSRQAWHALEAATCVLAADPDAGQASGIRATGMQVGRLDEEPAGAALVRLARDQRVVWLVSDHGDLGLTDAVAAEVSRTARPPEVELLVGSHDVPGARLLDLVAVMDRLRSPGGCPWDAEQTSASLLPYLLEETYELIEAVESGDLAHVREELGDVLLQVAFQARVAAEDPGHPFDIDDVAAGIVAKLVRRHPHVFGDVPAESAERVAHNWEQIKAVEKAGRTSVLDGIPAGMPALARAEKVLGRLERAGHAEAAAELAAEVAGGEEGLGAELLGLVRTARARGIDPEAALRVALRRVEAKVRAAEAARVSVLRSERV
ncbi:MAG TPA: MazG family protein [Dermatophilaceae bacterium]|nr:MazG family protein [Dermatophilaceae bacterium]